MTTRPPTRRTRFNSVIIVLSILLLGVASGLGLAISVRPQPNPKPLLNYEIILLRPDSPLTDFSAPLSLINPSIPRSSVMVVDSKGWQEQDYTQGFLKPIAHLQPHWISVNNSTAYLTRPFQLDVEGRENGGRIFTELIFRTQGRVSKHQFTVDVNQVQILVLDKGPPMRYALVRVSPQSSLPGGTTTLPNAFATKGAQK